MVPDEPAAAAGRRRETARFAATVRELRAELPHLLRGRERAAVQTRAAQLVAEGVGSRARCAAPR
ncbi:hypothetical protein BJF78_34455 [Pseudonocardia sp. CNS-139]|nr:hypothetical protein BJF78_34455 [Pseudonocardia sp. CNS-139]